MKRHPGRPSIQPWLRGWDDDPPQTAVVWRTDFPVRSNNHSTRGAEIEAFFEAAPPHTSEVLETETSHVVEWITARAGALFSQSSNQDQAGDGVLLKKHDTVAFVLDSEGCLRRSLSLEELNSLENRQSLIGLFAGSTVVVDSRLGGLRDGLLDGAVSEPPATADGSEWLGEGSVGFRIRVADASTASGRDPGWHERLRFAVDFTEESEPAKWLIVEKWRTDAATEEDRSEGPPQLLQLHQQRAEQRARELARTIGLRNEYQEILAWAALFHDEGKRTKRWQRAFNAPGDGPYAKTDGPIRLKLLDGYRHELGSLFYISRSKHLDGLSQEHRDLVLHLIAAHHGFARPTIGTSACEEAPPSLLEKMAAKAAVRFARLQTKWGPWGLAWWEALLRAADQLASRDNATLEPPGRGA